MSERAEYDRDREDLTTSDLVGESTARRDDRDEPRRDDSRSSSNDLEPLFSADVTRDLWSRWDDIQTGFVDEPRQAVEQADRLVAESIKRLAESFARERESLERQWDRGDDVSTEDLRVALKRYRSFFSRILSI
jgi:inorganic triphosphatase YgiF